MMCVSAQRSKSWTIKKKKKTLPEQVCVFIHTGKKQYGKLLVA